jgi:hypothetical protein
LGIDASQFQLTSVLTVSCWPSTLSAECNPIEEHSIPVPAAYAVASIAIQSSLVVARIFVETCHLVIHRYTRRCRRYLLRLDMPSSTMAYPLSTRDIHVLEKIRDPESDPSAGVTIDRTLPADPHVADQSAYLQIAQQEKEIIFSMQALELQIAGMRPSTGADAVEEYRACVKRLNDLIEGCPDYASARNNRAQALRRLYGDSMLVDGASPLPQVLIKVAGDSDRIQAAQTVLSDLDRSIALLSPNRPKGSLSPQAAKTLSLAHTQRAAIYHMTSKLLASGRSVSVDSSRREANWTKLEFEDAASRDFAMGGKYGNEIAKGLAVSTNPTAKLCGQIVREAMKKEYGPGFDACGGE